MAFDLPSNAPCSAHDVWWSRNATGLLLIDRVGRSRWTCVRVFRFSRHNVLHLWPYVITDLKNLGAKAFYGKFATGQIEHISTCDATHRCSTGDVAPASSGIRQLQCILLKVALLLGVEIYQNMTFVDVIEPTIGSHGRYAFRLDVRHHRLALLPKDGEPNSSPTIIPYCRATTSVFSSVLTVVEIRCTAFSTRNFAANSPLVLRAISSIITRATSRILKVRHAVRFVLLTEFLCPCRNQWRCQNLQSAILQRTSAASLDRFGKHCLLQERYALFCDDSEKTFPPEQRRYPSRLSRCSATLGERQRQFHRTIEFCLRSSTICNEILLTIHFRIRGTCALPAHRATSADASRMTHG